MMPSKSYKNVTHICLIDENPISVLSPLVDPYIPSHRVVFAVKENQQRDVDRLKKVLLPKGIKVSSWLLPTTTNTGELIDSFNKLVTGELQSNPLHQLVLNTSCGSRHYALAAFEVARNHKLHCFVVEPDFDHLYWLYPEEKANSAIAEKLKIQDYMTALDCTIGSIANHGVVDKSIRNLGASWASQVNYLENSLSTLNYLAFTADNPRLTSSRLSQAQLDDHILYSMLDDLITVGMLTINDDYLIFKNESARFFVNGGWLEEYVHGVILSLKKEVKTIQDCAQGVEIVRQVKGGTVKNELDVLALANNRLHLIECKTKKFEKGEGNDVIYKLDSLVDLLGGINGRAMLVSFKNIRISEKHRAKELDIHIIGSNELPNLSMHLKHWLLSA
jgi:hypothetical protein